MTAFWFLNLLILFALGKSQWPPLITEQPFSDYSHLGSWFSLPTDETGPYMLECEAKGEPPPNFKWTKNGKELNLEAYNGRVKLQNGSGTLVITSPQNDDMGHYQCFAYNELGTATSDSVFFRKPELESFDEGYVTTVFAREGEPFKISCSPPDGHPKPYVFGGYSQNGSYFTFQNSQGDFKYIESPRLTIDPEGTLWFSNVTRNDTSGEFLYICAASNFYTTEFGNRVNLTLYPPLNFPRVNAEALVHQYASNENVVALRGKWVKLWCIVGGTPLPEIKWTKVGAALPYDRLDYDNYNKTLIIKGVSYFDQGRYRCDAANGVGASHSHRFQLSVEESPYFTVRPEIQNAIGGESVVFKCEANGNPFPKIQWIHNGMPLKDDNPRIKFISGVLLIENVKLSDTGNYGCNASNKWGYVYKDVYLNVRLSPPEITEKPINVVTTVGKSVTLTCRVVGIPRPLNRWLKNEQELTGDRFSTLENGDLRIERVIFADAGEYLCEAENFFGNDSANGTLLVKEHTKIVEKPEDFKVAAGKTAIFRCGAVKDPTLYLTIDWLSDGEQIDFDKEPRYAKLEDNSLTVRNTTEMDSVEYTCVAKTEYDNATAQATLTVQNVPNMPELLSIECGRRTATIRWRPMGDNRSPILFYQIEYKTSFTPDAWQVAYREVPAIENRYTVSMSPWVNYTFRVIAKNEMGSSTPSRHSENCLAPSDVPYKNPENVKGYGSTPTNLIISWTPMPKIEHNAPKFKYVVQWKSVVDLSPWQLENINDWKQGQIVIENQPTYLQYKIRVGAVNEVGEANVDANDVIGYSGMDKPTESPANFTLIEKLDARTAIFCWDPVNPKNLRGKFEGYKIQTWTDNEGDRREILINNNVTQAVVDKLIPFSKNFAAVFAYNTDYNGPKSKIIEFITEEATPGPVMSFKAYPLGESALYLVWRKPDQSNGILTGYRIYFQNVVGTKVGALMERTPPIMNPETTDAKLARLQPGTSYRIHIKATTSMGPGEDSFVERSTEEEGQASPLNKPRFTWTQVTTESDDSAILVKWVPNLDGTGRAGSNFFVQYKRDSDIKFENSELVLYTLHTTVRGLQSGETYVFRVVSVDGDQQRLSESKNIRVKKYNATNANASSLLPKKSPHPPNPAKETVTHLRKQLTVALGRTAKLECNVSFNSSVYWTKNGKAYLFSGATLIIPNVQQNDSGEYHCEAAQKSEVIELFVQVSSPPLIIRQSQKKELWFRVKQHEDDFNQPLILECEAKGDPNPEYKWTKDGKEFRWTQFGGRISKDENNGTLTFRFSRNEDAGIYKCYASNKWGTASTNAVLLKKAELKAFKEKDSIKTIPVEYGQPFRLACPSPGGWPKPQIYWVKQHSQGALETTNSSRITVDPEGTLWFSSVTSDDINSTFVYTCAAYSDFINETQFGPRRALISSLASSGGNTSEAVVQYKSKKQITTMCGSTVRLWCIIGGTPLPKLTWSRNGKVLSSDQVEFENYGKTLKISNVGFEDEGVYDCTWTFVDAEGRQNKKFHPTQLSLYAIPRFKVEPELQYPGMGETVELKCEADGQPTPEITWTQNGVILTNAETNARRTITTNRILIENVTKLDTSNYGCNASNKYGYVYKDVFINVVLPPEEFSKVPENNLEKLIITVSMATLGAFVLVFVVCVLVVRHYRNAIAALVDEQDVDTFLKGDTSKHAKDSAFMVPYDKNRYEIHSKSFSLGKEETLGSGEFGWVCKGKILIGSEEITVAVKMANPQKSCKTTISGLLSEIKVLAYVGKHANITELLGANTEEMRLGRVYIFLEMCPMGSLEKYLRKLRPALGSTQNEVMTPSEYANIIEMKTMSSTLDPFLSQNLYRWSKEICNGMAFLATKHVVHADLATRNVLLGSNREAKICDFGLSRRMYNYASYVKCQREPLPWKWMAPESLRIQEFNEKTDIWAHGITLWEMYSLGDSPYQGLAWDLNFSSRLEQGFRLGKPQFDDTKMYALMKKCWELKPEHRPTFADLRAQFETEEADMPNTAY